VPDKDAVASDSLYTDEQDKQMTEDEETFLNSLPLSTSDDIWPSRTSVSSSSSEAVDDRILAQLRYIPRYITYIVDYAVSHVGRRDIFGENPPGSV